MSELTGFRDHCAQMSVAEHKPECVERLATWTRRQRAFRWLDVPDPGPKPDCDGCNSADDRALFARLAAEVDDYLTTDDEPLLWES